MLQIFAQRRAGGIYVCATSSGLAGDRTYRSAELLRLDFPEDTPLSGGYAALEFVCAAILEELWHARSENQEQLPTV